MIEKHRAKNFDLRIRPQNSGLKQFASQNSTPNSGSPGAKSQGCVNGGFQTVVRVSSREQIPAPHFNLNLTSVLPQFYLFLTSFLPQFYLCSAGNLEPRFGNHGLQTLGNPLCRNLPLTRVFFLRFGPLRELKLLARAIRRVPLSSF